MGIGGLKEKQSLIINFVLQKLGGGGDLLEKEDLSYKRGRPI